MTDIRNMMKTKKELNRQIDELTIENERLRKDNEKLRIENHELRCENARLQKRIDELESTLEERIKKAVDEAVAKATEPLLAIIAEKDKEILRLKAQLGKDSSNSSKPPSSNGFKKIPNNREKSGKKQGGQRGHKGSRLNIPENLDELVAIGKAEHVIVSDVADGEAYVSDWTVDIKVVSVYTEHRRKPGAPPKIEYGPELKAIAVYLSVIGLISVKRLSEFFYEITRNIINVSKATLTEFNRSVAEAIKLEPYVQDILNGVVLHVDETTIKTSERPNANGTLETAEKTTFNAYVRTYSNDTTTILTASPFKTKESVIADNILTRFHGIVSHDHEQKFYSFGDLNATCGGHLTRDLKGLSELQLLAWAESVRKFFTEMNNYKNEDINNGITVCEFSVLQNFEMRYDELLQAGKQQLESMKQQETFGYDELRRMVNRLEKYKDNYLLFIRNYDAPFTNNLAERDLRHCKTKQKVSGCFRSWQGVLDYCKIRSLLAPAKKRGENLLDSLLSLWSNPIPAGQ
jgi:transposase